MEEEREKPEKQCSPMRLNAEVNLEAMRNSAIGVKAKETSTGITVVL